MGKIYKNGIQYSGTTDAATNINYDNSKGAIKAGNVQGAIDEIMETTSQSRTLTQAEYDALPDTKYTDGIEYFITDAEPLDASTIAYDNTASKMTATNVQAGIDELNSSLAYSESEIICGTWIDGKPIYRKVFNITTGTAFNTFIQYNLSDYGITNVDEIISVNMRLKMSDDGWQIFSADGHYALFDCSKTVIEIKVMNNAYVNKPCRFIIEYTKVTD